VATDQDEEIVYRFEDVALQLYKRVKDGGK
jgi:hypothetical protein